MQEKNIDEEPKNIDEELKEFFNLARLIYKSAYKKGWIEGHIETRKTYDKDSFREE